MRRVYISIMFIIIFTSCGPKIPPEVKNALNRLEHRDVEVRKDASDELIRLVQPEDQNIINELFVKLNNEENRSVKKNIIQALTKIGGHKVENNFINIIKDEEDEEIVYTIVSQMEQINEELKNQLINILKSEKSIYIKASIINQLEKNKELDLVYDFLDLLSKEKSSEIKRELFNYLKNYSDQKVRDAAILILEKDNNTSIRLEAIEYLSEYSDDIALSALTQALHFDESESQKKIFFELKKKNKIQTNDILHLLNSNNFSLRQQVLFYIENHEQQKSQSLKSSLLKVIKEDPDLSLRLKAVVLIENIFGTKEVPAWSSPDGRFIDNRDGTLIDTKYKLMWEKSDNGRTYTTRSQAVNYCLVLNLAGYTDWRLPTDKESATLEVVNSNPCLHPMFNNRRRDSDYFNVNENFETDIHFYRVTDKIRSMGTGTSKGYHLYVRAVRTHNLN